VNVVPKRRLGQNFLVDENILGVIGRLAELGPHDVVLEVGSGLGVLTRYLAERVARVHAVELDASLAAKLTELPPNVELEVGDAMRVDLGRLAPTKFVANLPYNVATPLIVESLDGLPSVDLWCVMVQREVANRLFAEPSTKAYGAVSVLVQVACVRTGRRPVSRRVFAPEPNVDSALVAFRRRPPFAAGPEWDRLARVVHAAFGHRRKTLRNAFALAGLPLPPADVAALRAEALTPERYVRLAEELAA
jgi:16S rRNA (adenine1518-N6/adenine1519-N6)-dimethyltransferase